jgi:hypothetical protein
MGERPVLANERAEEYKNNKPFPHIYFDDFLPVEAAEAALKDFAEPKQLAWSGFNYPNERKLDFDVVERPPASVRDVLYFLNSRPMIEFLEVLMGIKGVTPDPHYVGVRLHDQTWWQAKHDQESSQLRRDAQCRSFRLRWFQKCCTLIR